MAQWVVPVDELSSMVNGIIDKLCLGLFLAAILAAKKCIEVAQDQSKKGYEMEIETSLDLVQNPDTKKRITVFLTGN